MSKLIIIAAPSGSGKSTIVKYLMQNPELNLHFSISATTRQPRGTEKDGVEYHFITPEKFREHIANNDFIEYEQVYTDKYYGTLRSQVDSQLDSGQNVIFDVDVKGALNIKQAYGKRALAIFIQPPSIEELRNRLTQRGTDTEADIQQRIDKAAYELTFAKDFDEVVINDNLEIAQIETETLIEDFIDEQ